MRGKDSKQALQQIAQNYKAMEGFVKSIEKKDFTLLKTKNRFSFIAADG